MSALVQYGSDSESEATGEIVEKVVVVAASVVSNVESSASVAEAVVVSPCSMCAKESKYTCPGCKVRSCSQVCSQQHKKQTSCTGKRPSSTFLKVSQMNTDTLYNDMRLLNNVSSMVGSDRNEEMNTNKKPSSKLHKSQTHACTLRGVHLEHSPSMFKNFQINTSSVYSRKLSPNVADVISWHQELSCIDMTKSHTSINEMTLLSTNFGGVLEFLPLYSVFYGVVYPRILLPMLQKKDNTSHRVTYSEYIGQNAHLQGLLPDMEATVYYKNTTGSIGSIHDAVVFEMGTSHQVEGITEQYQQYMSSVRNTTKDADLSSVTYWQQYEGVVGLMKVPSPANRPQFLLIPVSTSIGCVASHPFSHLIDFPKITIIPSSLLSLYLPHIISVVTPVSIYLPIDQLLSQHRQWCQALGTSPHVITSKIQLVGLDHETANTLLEANDIRNKFPQNGVRANNNPAYLENLIDTELAKMDELNELDGLL